ncbi:regulator of microtubule dynamics protein 1 isoform X1 [Dermochelys coriacea]|uniref:regulator of microtubule dynamics protein 1 isoform X1 n=1 Tax=Dermochelys coriacea TaxID=27794 RepID=UPI001CAA280E|nr:regulator of microtubule dynamics protein 1 isoform X1 [Dermochelys coriacea]
MGERAANPAGGTERARSRFPLGRYRALTASCRNREPRFGRMARTLLPADRFRWLLSLGSPGCWRVGPSTGWRIMATALIILTPLRRGAAWVGKRLLSEAGGLRRGWWRQAQVFGKLTLFRRGLALSAVSYLSYEAYNSISHSAVVHASVKVEEIIEQADYLYGSGETEKLYQLLTQHKNSEDAEILWRLARASRDLAQLSSTTAEEKKQLVYEALEYAKKALEKNESNFAVHKWYAICISDVGDYEGIKTKIANAYVIKEHFQALSYFHKAEEVDPNFYSKNLLLLGKTYLKLKNKKMALLWLTKIRDYPAHTEEDKQVQKEAVELLNSI